MVVTKYLLTGMILQVLHFLSSYAHVTHAWYSVGLPSAIAGRGNQTEEAQHKNKQGLQRQAENNCLRLFLKVFLLTASF